MRLIDIRFHLLMRNKRIIDKWVDRSGVVYIDQVCSGYFDRIQVIIFMIEPVAPLKICIDRVEWCDEQGEIII
ncbi:hypothetical protein D3C85_1345970 [compost metagenome]